MQLEKYKPTMYQFRMSRDQKDWSEWINCSQEESANCGFNTGYRGLHYEVRNISDITPAAMVPDGFTLVAVKGLNDLVLAMGRAEDKGYLPDAMAEEWTAFEYRLIGL